MCYFVSINGIKQKLTSRKGLERFNDTASQCVVNCLFDASLFARWLVSRCVYVCLFLLLISLTAYLFTCSFVRYIPARW